MSTEQRARAEKTDGIRSDVSTRPNDGHRASDKLLFTPGPLTTSMSVKEAMLCDLGSRDGDFIEAVRGIRTRLLEIAGVSQHGGYEAILMQGSGTFGLESVVTSTVPADGKLLVIINGAYGRRIVQMAERMGVETEIIRCAEHETPDPAAVDRTLRTVEGITNVTVVHCETTTGIVNPIAEIGEVVNAHGCMYMVDAMSSFGAISIDMRAAHIDFLVTSANKCLEGVPGFSIILARREALLEAEGRSRSLSFDLQAQWRGLEKNGQFRFTPPTHTMLALSKALAELEQEGGVPGRSARYKANHDVLMRGMRRLGFETYLRRTDLSSIITSFLYPPDPRFSFSELYERLNARGFVIYPGKVTQADCFRIGTIGRIEPADVERLVASIEDALGTMGVDMDAAEQKVPG